MDSDIVKAVFSRLWDEGRQLLENDVGPTEGGKSGDSMTLDDTLGILKEASSKASMEYGDYSVGRSEKPLISIKLGRIMQRLEIFMKIGDGYMNGAPESVSLIWMSFRIIFGGFLQDAKTCEFFTDAVDQITDIMFLCSVLQRRYLKTNGIVDITKPTEDRIIAQIPPLYAAVMKFSYESRKLFKHRKLKRPFMPWRSIELRETLSDAQLKRKNLQDTAGIGFQEAALDALEGIKIDQSIIREISEVLEAEVVPGIKNIQASQADSKEAERRAEIEKVYKEQLEWLKTGRIAELAAPGRTQANIQAKIHPGSTNWALESPDFRAWRNSSGGSLCWFWGNGGFGKSFLITSMIHHLQNTPWTTSPPHIVYFYCHKGDRATSNGKYVFLHLLVQLYEKVAPGNSGATYELQNKFGNAVKEVWKQTKPEEKHDASLVQMQLTMALLFDELVKIVDSEVIVCVDGLDECDDRDDEFLQCLLARSRNGAVKVIISSRPEIFFRARGTANFSIEVTKQQTQTEIAKYIRSKVQGAKYLKPNMRKKAYKKITEQSEGSFRYADVVLESLFSSKTEMMSPNQLLSSLPTGMIALYRQSMANLGPHLRRVLIVALRWLMCSVGPITLDVIADELNGRWNTAEESEESDNCESEFGEDYDGFQYETEGGNHSTNSSTPLTESHRGIVQELCSAGRDFLVIDGNTVSMQHNSVRDFIMAEEEVIRQKTERCAECKQRFQETIAYEAGPKEGNFSICQIIVQRLNNPEFQRTHILDMPPWSYFQDPKDFVRYEVSQWPFHFRQLEQATQETRPLGWRELFDDLEIFLRPGSQAYSKWLRTIYPDSKSEILKTTPLHVAARFGIMELIDRYIDREQYDIRARDVEGNTTLHHACRMSGNHHVIKRLYENGADLNARNNGGETPLIVLLKSYSGIEDVELLLCLGSQVDLADDDGVTALHRAIETSDFRLCEMLLGNESVDVNAKDHRGETALHWACRALGTTDELIELLISKGVDVNERCNNGRTPLYYSCACEHSKSLVKRGAKINVKDLDGVTPLEEAILYKSEEHIELLITFGADLLSKNKHGRNALFQSLKLVLEFRSKIEYEIILKALLEKGQLEDSYRSWDYHQNHTPLHWAVLFSHQTVVEDLLKYGDMSQIKDLRNKDGNTALHLAAKESNPYLTLLLLDAGFDPALKNYEKHLTPFQMPVVGWKFGCTNEDSEYTFALTVLTILAFVERAPKAIPANLLHFIVEANMESPLCSMLRDSRHEEDRFGWSALALARHLKKTRKYKVLVDTDEDTTPRGMGFEPTKLDLTRAKTSAPKYSELVFGTSEDGLSLLISPKPVAGLADTTKSAQTWWSVLKPKTKDTLIIDTDALDWTCATEKDYCIGAPIFLPRPSTSSADMIVLSDYPVPAMTPVFYFEIELLRFLPLSYSTYEAIEISVGFFSEFWPNDNNHTTDCFWTTKSWYRNGVHELESSAYIVDGFLRKYGEAFSAGDVIGCGFEWEAGHIFFTKNGRRLPPVISNVTGRLFPGVIVGRNFKSDIELRANFGEDLVHKPFLCEDGLKPLTAFPPPTDWEPRIFEPPPPVIPEITLQDLWNYVESQKKGEEWEVPLHKQES